MSALRLLHVTPYSEHAWAYGGIPRVVAALSAGLAAREHAVTICTTDVRLADERLPVPAGISRRQPWSERSAYGVTVRVFPNVSNRAAYHLQLFLPIGLSRYLREHAAEFDVGHIHACRNLPGVIAARELRRAGVPYVLQPHGTAPRLERRLLAKALFDRTVGRNVTPGAAALLAVTEAERRQLQQLGVPDDRIAVVPNPVDLAEFDPPPHAGAFRARLGLGTEPIVLFLGKLTPRKRLDVLAHAFARLQRDDARLVVAGNDMGYGRQLAGLVDRLGIRDRTMVPGLLTGHERLEALADADVVVYPSKDEIFGLVPVESLMCGTPVVVADDSGCAEVIRHLGGGIVTRQGDAASLQHAIATILGGRDHWRHVARAASRSVPAFCGTPAVVEQLETVYLGVMRRASRS